MSGLAEILPRRSIRVLFFPFSPSFHSPPLVVYSTLLPIRVPFQMLVTSLSNLHRELFSEDLPRDHFYSYTDRTRDPHLHLCRLMREVVGPGFIFFFMSAG